MVILKLNNTTTKPLNQNKMDILKLNNENSNVCTLCGSHRVEEADKINNHCLDCGDIIPKYKLFISKRLDKIEFDFDKGNFYINNNEAKQLIEFLQQKIKDK